MKKISIAVIALSLTIPVISLADQNHACSVMLCLANPKGPTAANGCSKPIRKLFRDLLKGKSFPVCTLVSPPAFTEDNASHINITQGFERFHPCKAGFTSVKNEHYFQPVCQKFITFEIVDIASGEREAVYETYPQPFRRNPNWIQVITMTDKGIIEGEKFWYKKPRKKKFGVF